MGRTWIARNCKQRVARRNEGERLRKLLKSKLRQQSFEECSTCFGCLAHMAVKNYAVSLQTIESPSLMSLL